MKKLISLLLVVAAGVAAVPAFAAKARPTLDICGTVEDASGDAAFGDLGCPIGARVGDGGA